MNNKKVILYFDQIPIAALSMVKNRYYYEIYQDNLDVAFGTGYPLISKSTKTGLLDELPTIFYEFNISPMRKDLYELLGIEKGDTRFEKLYKMALKSDHFSHRGFWISTE